MISLFQQIVYILSWVFILFLFKNTFRIFFETHLPVEYSRPISYILPLFIFGYVSWFLVLLEIPYQYIWFIVIFAGIYCIYHRISLIGIIKEDILWDSGFLFFFSMFLISYSFYSDIFSMFDIERERGVMMMASILRTPSVPPLDPSFCGGFLDIYYYLIFWVFAGIGFVTNTPVSFINGLAASVIFGISAVLLISIGKIIIPQLSFLPLIILIIPRPSFFYVLFTVPGLNSILSICEKSIFGIIDGCDYDYQLTGTLYQNIHPMIGALALRLIVIFLLLIIMTKWDNLVFREKQILLGLLSIASALLFITYTWDAIIFAPFIMVVFFYLAYSEFKRNYSYTGENHTINLKKSITGILNLTYPVIPGVLLLLIWLSKMNNAGITGLVLNYQTRLSFIDMLLVNGWMICILFIHCFEEIRKKPLYILIGIIPIYFGYASLSLLLIPLIYLIIKNEKSWYDYFAVWAIIGLFFSELFTLVNAFYGPDRFNTTLKFNWILWPIIWIFILGICNSWLIKFGRLNKNLVNASKVVLVLIFIIVIIISPALSYGNITQMSIDGAQRAESLNPDLPKIITLLSNDPNATCIVDKTYKDSLSGISILSGIPNYVQSPLVERIWGRDGGEIEKRENIVKEIYTNNSFSITDTTPHISYIILDEYAIKLYGNISMNKTSLQEIYSNNTLKIYKNRETLPL